MAAFIIPEEDAFVRFMHERSSDEGEQVMAVTVEVLSMWQMSGRALTHQPPGYLLVNMTEATVDPLGQIGIFNHGMQKIGPDGEKFGSPTPADAKALALKSMRVFTESYRLIKTENELKCAQGFWAQNIGRAFGVGPSGGYADRWDEELELVTDDTGNIVLLLHRDEDWAMFREHVANEPTRLSSPQGFSKELELVTKVATVSGTLVPRELDDRTLESILEEGLPILVLPHSASAELAAVRSSPLSNLTARFLKITRAVQTPRRLVPVKLPIRGVPMVEYEGILLSLCHHLPANYGFYLLRTLRELHLVCDPIAIMAAGKGSPLTRAISVDLRHLTVRGIVTGVASLAYHGWCFDAGIPRSKTVKLLAALRDTGKMTCRELQRLLRDCDAQKLKSVLETLEDQGLVQIDGKVVTAVPMPLFVRSIPARHSFPTLKLETEAYMKTLCGKYPGPANVSPLELLASLRGTGIR